MKKALILFLASICSLIQPLAAQDLMDLLAEDESSKTEFAYATFKATRIVNSQSIENPPNGAMIFIILHRTVLGDEAGNPSDQHDRPVHARHPGA